MNIYNIHLLLVFQLDKFFTPRNNIPMKKRSIIISIVGIIALISLFTYWWATTPGVTISGHIAAIISATLFGAICLRFVPGWMAFWTAADTSVPRLDHEPAHILPKIFLSLLLLNFSIILLAALLRSLWHYSDGLLFWTCTDSQHYLDIAREWYLSEGEWDRLVQLVFLPGYPIAVRLLNLLIPDTLISGMLVSSLCFSGAGCVYYRLLRLDVSHQETIRALKYLCLLPGAFFFIAPMSESLFLLMCLSCLYSARQGNWFLAGFWGGLAAFTRSLGLILVVPLFFQWIHTRQAGLHLKRFFSLCLIPLGFGAYCLINYRVAGNPFQFMEYQSVHWGQHLGWFWNTAAYQTEWALRTITTDPHNFWGLWLPNLTYGFGTLLLMLFAVKKLRPDYSAWFLAYYFIAMGATWLLSAPRYLIALPTVSTAMAAVTQDHRADTAVTILCGTLSFFYFCAFLLRWQVW